MEIISRGSEWRKWDLHIHTPESFHWNGGKRFAQMNDEEVDKEISSIINKINASDVAVFAVVDYWTVEGYFRIKRYLNDNPGILNSNKLILPGIEIRISAPVNYRLNMQVIFDNHLSDQNLRDFIGSLKIYSTERKLSEDALREFALSLSPDKAAHHGHQDYENDNDSAVLLGSKTAEITPASFEEALSSLPKRESCFVVMPWDTSDGLKQLNWRQHAGSANEFMGLPDIFESRDVDMKLTFNGIKTDKNSGFFESFYSCLGNKPRAVICGSDAHTISDYGEFPSDVCTWIKADTTFEGLRQIIYEPDSRVVCGADAPLAAFDNIDNLKVNIPSNAKVGNDKFCFSGCNTTLYLSSAFNCFIGGRGSGKSSILNLLGLRSVDPSSSENFWDGLTVQNFDPNDINVFDTEGTSKFEYLGQSEVEAFAVNKSRFTRAIYDRANALSNFGLGDICSEIDKYLDDLDEAIDVTKDIQLSAAELEAKKKDKNDVEKMLNALTNPDYLKSTKIIQEKASEIKTLTNSKSRMTFLRSKLTILVDEFEMEEIGNAENGYQSQTRASLEKITEAISLLSDEIFTREDENLVQLLSDLETLKAEHEKVLLDLNLSENQIQQMSNAPQKLVSLNHDIDRLEEVYKAKVDSQHRLWSSISSINGEKDRYEEALLERLEPIINKLHEQFVENAGENIKEISLSYSFDDVSAWEAIGGEFYETFKNEHDIKRSGEVVDFISSNADEFNSLNHQDLVSFLDQTIGNSPQQYFSFVINVLRDPSNYNILKLIIAKHLYNVRKYQIIDVLYDGKPVEQASFGQRCTAVVVILVLFGQYPLIIDEPEAHLDSPLIANYLVPLIKKVKNERQIIFATHNANFVVNADAEKIFILKNITGVTEIHETSIENLAHRSDLLSLEGGAEAFRKRGEKLDI